MQSTDGSTAVKLDSTLVQILETLFNRYLAMDPETASLLGVLEGKCIGFDLSDPDILLYCRPRAKAVSLSLECEQEPDCVIKGTVLHLLKMMRNDDPAQSLSSGEIEIIGDSRIAQDFSDILKNVEIDWEELVSKVTGDFAAHRIGNAARQAKSWFEETLEALRLDVSDYLREESGILPTATEIGFFMRQVDEFRNDVDRLEARIKRLEKRLTEARDA
jgi:ubiquinone biosynthesis protein UbiJ